MKNIDKKVSEATIIIVGIIIGIVFLLSTPLSNNSIFIVDVPFIESSAAILLVIAIPGILYVFFTHGMALIDSYVDAMLSGKKYSTTSDNFYCQACKAPVGKDDSFCENCGMTM